MLFNILKSHVILHNPPYDIGAILANYQRFDGVRITVTIRHRDRDVSIVQPSISRLVLSTAVTAFQRHRLRSPYVMAPIQHVLRRQVPDLQSVSCHRTTGESIGKMCSVCMEEITSNNVRVLACAHVFHSSCIDRWFLEQRTCPECRTSA